MTVRHGTRYHEGHPFVRQKDRLIRQFSRGLGPGDARDALLVVLVAAACLAGLGIVWAYVASLRMPAADALPVGVTPADWLRNEPWLPY